MDRQIITIIEKYIKNANQEVVWILEDLLKEVKDACGIGDNSDNTRNNG